MELFNKLTCCAVMGISMTGVMAEAATYEVVFDQQWTQGSHPTDFPTGAPPAGAHFSPLVGGTHDSGVTFWEVGGMATSGVQQMAETGNPTGVLADVNAAITAGTAGETIVGSGPAASPGSQTITFEATDDFSLLTLSSMIAPSPDWFVGVSGLELKDGGGIWQNEIIVDLFAYDAGTDGGTNFLSANDPLVSHEAISSLVGSSLDGEPRLGTFTITLIPEPASFAMMGVLGGLGLLRRNK